MLSCADVFAAMWCVVEVAKLFSTRLPYFPQWSLAHHRHPTLPPVPPAYLRSASSLSRSTTMTLRSVFALAFSAAPAKSTDPPS
jgi:hypothetical protein